MKTSLPLSASVVLLICSVAWAQAAPSVPDTDAPRAAPLPSNATSTPLSAPVEKVTLDQAVARALAKNPTARTALEQVRQVSAQMEQVRSASLPVLTAGAGYNRLDRDRRLNGAVILGKDQLSGNVALSVPLISGRSWANWARAVDLIDIARANETDIRRLLGVTTARAYLSVETQRHVVDINARARDNAKAHLDFAQRRLEGGVGNRIDAVRADQELQTDQSNLQTSIAGLARAQEALGVFLAVDHRVDTADDSPELSVPQDEQAATDGAQRSRSDVLVDRERVDAAKKSLNLSWTEYLPTLNGVAEGLYQNPPTLTQPAEGWQVLLSLTLPLYDGGLRYGLTHERRAILAISEQTLEASLRQAQSDARAAYDALRNADSALSSAKKAASLGQQALTLADLAYRAGATTDIEVIDAQRRARDADTQAALAQDNDLQARLDLLNAAGLFPNAQLLKAEAR